MLKSTYKPSPNLSPPPLPAGWTQHTAPAGHTYYYNAETKESTYTRPGAPSQPASSFLQYQAVPSINLSDPAVANAFMTQYSAANAERQLPSRRGGFGAGSGREGADIRPSRPQPIDKPRSKAPIPGCEPWILVSTKLGRRFAYNPVKNMSYWRIPEKLKAGIIQLDQERIRDKAGMDGKAREEGGHAMEARLEGNREWRDADGAVEAHNHDSSEYEEVEVTDDEGADDEHNGPSKRRRTDADDESDGDDDDEDNDEDRPVEFSEADIAFQLQAMGEEYGLEPGEYDDGNMEQWPEGAEGLALSDEDARGLFKDLLNDFHINPYGGWEKLIEEGKVIDDPRYTVLNTMKARKDTWEEWSREKIRELKDRRAKEEKKDPRIPYLAFLQARATPKLYWPEFKRKYKKEDVMRDSALSDKDREKWYREHINRLKLPLPTLKSDLTTLLKSLPLAKLNSQTLPTHLPPQILTDIRFVSLDPKIRDPLIEAYIQILGPPPETSEVAEEENETTRKAREERMKREMALQDREKAVAEEKRMQAKKRRIGRANLREEERELERAMTIGKGGLQSQLAAGRDKSR